MATTAEVADRVSAAPRTVQRRLRALHDEGRIRSKEVGARSRVWWVTHDHADTDA